MTLAALTAAAILGRPMVGAVELNPTDDIWVYPHASDPQRDPFLRVWGAGGNAAPAEGEDANDYSMSYLRFNLATIPAGAKIEKATLVLTHTAGAGYDEKLAKESPIEVRFLATPFAEKDWDFGKVTSIRPSSKGDAIFGKAAPTGFKSDATFTLEIDLMKGPAKFADAVANAKGGSLGMALTSTIDPSVGGRSAVYRFFSKDTENAKQKPVLKITFAN